MTYTFITCIFNLYGSELLPTTSIPEFPLLIVLLLGIGILTILLRYYLIKKKEN